MQVMLGHRVPSADRIHLGQTVRRSRVSAMIEVGAMEIQNASVLKDGQERPVANALQTGLAKIVSSLAAQNRRAQETAYARMMAGADALTALPVKAANFAPRVSGVMHASHASRAPLAPVTGSVIIVGNASARPDLPQTTVARVLRH